MNLIFFVSLKNVKEHEFHFFFVASLKTSKTWISFFASLKNLKKHEFHEEEDIGNGRRALQQLLENSDSDSESESWCITWIFSPPSFRTKIANFLTFRPRIYGRNDQCSLIFKRNPSNSACKIILVSFFFVKILPKILRRLGTNLQYYYNRVSILWAMNFPPEGRTFLVQWGKFSTSCLDSVRRKNEPKIKIQMKFCCVLKILLDGFQKKVAWSDPTRLKM